MARKTDHPEDLTGSVEEAIECLHRHADSRSGPVPPKVLKPGEKPAPVPPLSARLSAALDRALLG